METGGHNESELKRTISYSDPNHIRGLIQKNKYDSFDKFKLNLEAYELKKFNAIDKLISMDILRTKIDAHPYQMNVALSVLKDMNTNAILADEVGLGKTIEAGMILKELLMREVIHSVLILVPKALLNQWRDELREKFGEDFIIVNDNPEFTDFDYHDKIICSTGLLLHRAQKIMKRKWDLIIVDEAHVYRNTKGKGRMHLSQIPRTHLLLLTATPINNKLTDLFSLIDLVYPGLLETESSFISRYAEDSKCRVVRGDTVDELRNRIIQVMCRTRRIESGIPFTKRFVESRRIEASNEELEFIDKSTEYLKDLCNSKFKTVEELKVQNPTKRSTSEAQSRAILIFQAISMQQSISSSPKAALETLQKRYRKYPGERSILKELISLAQKIKPSKLELLKKVLKEVKNEQAVIFCLRKATANELKRILDKEFGKSEVYSGDVSSPSKRKKILEEFKEGNIKYLVATDAAAEGLNLQHCNVLFNYDLHWNPMKIEQRIGRVHRFGQERDVTIFNLCVKDTIDDYVLHILFQKIDLFAMTIGSMETILSEIKEDVADIDKTIMDIIIRSKSKKDIKKELEELSKNIQYAKKKQSLAEKFTKGVLG
tara:strand:- start:2853 stop:4655 length:1803 start_codon:yes stop_codon:yes gene_type:complete